MELTQWDSIYDLYKLSLVKLFYNIVNDNIPSTISDLAVWRNSPYDLRGYKKAVVPRFSTYFVKNSIRYRGALLQGSKLTFLLRSQLATKGKNLVTRS